jgi:N-acetylglutamate synthase-like GNAT family acetyltransferase
MGAAIVATLEDEARAHRCRAIYLLTESERDFFARLGYAACAPGDVPDAVRNSGRYERLCDSAAVMVKHVG